MENKKNFIKIYQKYVDKIYRFIYLKVNSTDIAEDLTSDLFLNIWEKISKNPNFVKNIKNMRAFLYKSAYNKVIDYYKQNSNKKEVFISDGIDIINVEQAQSITNIEIEEAKKLLDKLKPKYKDIIIFYYIEELTTKEIAEITGKSEVNIRVIISRGLKKLREMDKN